VNLQRFFHPRERAVPLSQQALDVSGQLRIHRLSLSYQRLPSGNPFAHRPLQSARCLPWSKGPSKLLVPKAAFCLFPLFHGFLVPACSLVSSLHPFRCLKNSTCRSRFFASSNVL
jgi:hypothetical protein